MKKSVYDLILCVCLSIILLPSISYASMYELTYDNHQIEEISGDKSAPTKLNYVSIVTLAPNKVSVKVNLDEVIYDFNNITMTTIDHSKKTYSQYSLYAKMYFLRMIVFDNRTILNLFETVKKLDEKEEALAYIGNDFEIENAQGIKFGDGVTKNIKEEIKGNVHNFVFNNRQVASITLEENLLKEEFRDAFKKFIIHNVPLHPDIREKILSNNKLFSHIKYERKNINQIITTDISLKSAKEIQEYEIKTPAGYKRIYSQDEELNAILTQAYSKIGMMTEAEYKEEIDRLIDDKCYLDAFLTISEREIQYDSDPREQYQHLISLADNVEQIQKLSNALLAKSKKEAEEAIKCINELKKQDLKHKYVLDVFLDKIYKSQKEYKKAHSHYKNALKHNPFMMEVYMDYAAQLLFIEMNVYTAWQCLEVVREIMPGFIGLEGLKEREEKMEKDNPEFF